MSGGDAVKTKQSEQQRNARSRQRVASRHQQTLAAIAKQAVAIEALELEVRSLREKPESAKPWWKFW